jgi:hypothetical protein
VAAVLVTPTHTEFKTRGPNLAGELRNHGGRFSCCIQPLRGLAVVSSDWLVQDFQVVHVVDDRVDEGGPLSAGDLPIGEERTVRGRVCHDHHGEGFPGGVRYTIGEDRRDRRTPCPLSF